MSRRRLEINKKHCSYKELESHYKSCTDAKLKTRLLAVMQICDGKTSTEVEEDIHMSHSNILKRAPKGAQPIVPTDTAGSRERVVMFGAADQVEGKVHYSTAEAGNSESFKDFLKGELKNITFKYLPPYSSELNAIEHLWKDIRKNVTHNYLFESIAEIVQAIRKYFMNVQRCSAKLLISNGIIKSTDISLA